MRFFDFCNAEVMPDAALARRGIARQALHLAPLVPELVPPHRRRAERLPPGRAGGASRPRAASAGSVGELPRALAIDGGAADGDGLGHGAKLSRSVFPVKVFLDYPPVHDWSHRYPACDCHGRSA
jgi:hypothetical protein